MIIDGYPRLGCKCEECVELVTYNKENDIYQVYTPSLEMINLISEDYTDNLMKKLKNSSRKNI